MNITYDTFNDKKIISSNGVGSWDIRMNDIVAAMRTWLKFPFFGSGFYNLKEIYSNYSVIRNTGTPTMGFLNILAFGGIYMFLGYLGGLVRYLLLIKHLKSKVMFYTFLLLTVAFMCTSGNQYSYTILLIIAIGWSISASDFKMCN